MDNVWIGWDKPWWILLNLEGIKNNQILDLNILALPVASC